MCDCDSYGFFSSLIFSFFHRIRKAKLEQMQRMCVNYWKWSRNCVYFPRLIGKVRKAREEFVLMCQQSVLSIVWDLVSFSFLFALYFPLPLLYCVFRFLGCCHYEKSSGFYFAVLLSSALSRDCAFLYFLLWYSTRKVYHPIFSFLDFFFVCLFLVGKSYSFYSISISDRIRSTGMYFSCRF